MKGLKVDAENVLVLSLWNICEKIIVIFITFCLYGLFYEMLTGNASNILFYLTSKYKFLIW